MFLRLGVFWAEGRFEISQGPCSFNHLLPTRSFWVPCPFSFPFVVIIVINILTTSYFNSNGSSSNIPYRLRPSRVGFLILNLIPFLFVDDNTDFSSTSSSTHRRFKQEGVYNGITIHVDIKSIFSTSSDCGRSPLIYISHVIVPSPTTTTTSRIGSTRQQ